MAGSFGAFNLQAGATYRVVREFIDFDGGLHPIGETWTYLEKNFFPYDAGLTLYVQANGGERSIRLQDYAEAQGKVIDHFSDYVELIQGG